MQRRQFVFALLSAPLLGALLPVVRASGRTREPIVGLPCEGCEAVFEGLPEKISSRARIAHVGEPGEPLTLWGVVKAGSGLPQAGVTIYAYHTDQSGRYSAPANPIGDAATRHGRLRAWAKTGVDGRYQFDTIRPGSYVGRDIPEHIHMHVIEPGRATYYIDDVMFLDDPKLTPQKMHSLTHGRGGNGVDQTERRNGIWHVQRDIVLGLNIPGYPK